MLLMHRCQGVDIDYSEHSKYDDDIIEDDGNGNSVNGKSLKTGWQIIALAYKHVLGSPSKKNWRNAVITIANNLNLTKNQHRKVSKVFELCEAAKEK
eukprot:8155131-Ditylum_brightwellii.AAC.1